MARVFEPPYADTVSPVSFERGVDPLANRLMRHFKNRARGRSVLKLAGVYSTLDYPTTDQIAAASEVYLGGHVYVVSDTVADALDAAGYTTTEWDAPDGVEGYEWRDIAHLSWFEFAEQRAWG